MSKRIENVVAFPNQGNLAVTSPVQEEQYAARFDLLSKLQTTLHADRLLELFFEMASRRIQLHGFEYRHESLGLAISGGRPGRYQASYQLFLEGESLGEFRAKRKQRYLEAELEYLEQLLGVLAYPLRNALLYKKALQDAHTDELTGVGNRSAFQSALSRECKAARRHAAPLSLIALDVDFFKRINDSYGHPCGDQVLQQVAKGITEITRGSDQIFRCGGEEFAILLSGTSLEGAALLAERMRRKIEDSLCNMGQVSVKVTASLGVATLSDNESENEFFSRADQALYQAKQAGRNRVALQGAAA